MNRIISFFKRETILCIAFILAVISSFLVPADREYINYIDFRVLVLLFSLMSVMSGLQTLGVFEKL